MTFAIYKKHQVLLSGDSDGFVIVWSLASYRPKAIWKAHEKALLGISIAGSFIISHGRDNKLYTWEFLEFEDMTSNLPIAQHEIALCTRRKPFMHCALDVNALNFCRASIGKHNSSLFVAVPGLIGSEYMDIFDLLTGDRLATRILPSVEDGKKTGTVMHIDFAYPLLAAAYENGSVALFELQLSSGKPGVKESKQNWRCLQTWTAHRDAALSVTINETKTELFSCGVDDRIVRYAIATSEVQTTGTKHAGQQSIVLRSDGKLLFTACWDGSARVYSVSTLRQLAVLRYHKLALHAVAAMHKKVDSPGIIALASKDSKISLWHIY